MKEAFETRPRSLPISSTLQLLDKDTQGQLKVFSAQLCWHFAFALLRGLSYKKDPGPPVLFMQSCFGKYTLFHRQGRLPPAATKPVRSSSSFTVESLLRSAAVKLRAPGNKPGTGEDGCHFEAVQLVSIPPPQGLLLLCGCP